MRIYLSVGFYSLARLIFGVGSLAVHFEVCKWRAHGACVSKIVWTCVRRLDLIDKSRDERELGPSRERRAEKEDRRPFLCREIAPIWLTLQLACQTRQRTRPTQSKRPFFGAKSLKSVQLRSRQSFISAKFIAK